MRAGVRRVAQIECGVAVVETPGRDDNVGALRLHLRNQLRLHDIEKISGAAEKSYRRRLIVRRHEPDHLVGDGPAPIIRAICLEYDSGSAIPRREPEPPTSHRCPRETASLESSRRDLTQQVNGENHYRTRGLEECILSAVVKPNDRRERVRDRHRIYVVEIRGERRSERCVLYELKRISHVLGAHRNAIVPPCPWIYMESHRQRVGTPPPAIRQPRRKSGVANRVE